MSDLRAAYKRWGDKLDQILREPTPEDLAKLWPSFAWIIPEHTPKRKDGKPLTVGDYLDFTNNAYRAKQKRDIIELLMTAETSELVIDHFLPRSHPQFKFEQNLEMIHGRHLKKLKWHKRLWRAIRIRLGN